MENTNTYTNRYHDEMDSATMKQYHQLQRKNLFLIARYTSKDISIYHKGCRDRDDKLLNTLGCRCTKFSTCPVCTIRKKRKQIDKMFKGERNDNRLKRQIHRKIRGEKAKGKRRINSL